MKLIVNRLSLISSRTKCLLHRGYRWLIKLETEVYVIVGIHYECVQFFMFVVDYKFMFCMNILLVKKRFISLS